MKMQRKETFTCIVCPRACEVTVTAEEKNIVEVKGNLCQRGEKYASSEFTQPTRIVTTTVQTMDGRMLPVKTSTPIPKEKQEEAMKQANKAKAKTPVNVGDVIIANIAGTNANLVATKKIE